MPIHILYRACATDKPAIRPEYYSKLLCAKSLLRAISVAPIESVHVIFDGDEHSECVNVFVQASPRVRLTRLAHVGNSASFQFALSTALALSSNDVVYFVEDDYLHTPEALSKLAAAFDDLHAADYITLYDHPVRYISDFSGGVDIPHCDTRIFFAGRHHWRTHESTCMTFASRVRTLREDVDVFQYYLHNRDAPNDRELFRALQALPGYESRSKSRLLLGPIPSLATHCHLPWLAPGVDWQQVARGVANPSEPNPVC